jgi:hypothetical protein
LVPPYVNNRLLNGNRADASTGGSLSLVDQLDLKGCRTV